MANRILTIGTSVYHYKIGRGFTKIKNLRTNKSHVVSHSKMTGIDPYYLERSQWKGGTIHQITPGMVADFIKKHGLIFSNENIS